MIPRTWFAVLSVALAGTLASACGGGGSSSESHPVPQPTRAQFKAAGLGKLPVAPEGKRVDLTAPPFSNPTNVTNPLFPISDLHSAILNGTIDGKPFHTETTLLPYTRTIEWTPGEQVETLVSQYVAFLDGRIQEVALDYYAQADDGSVWYFGEDVVDYNTQGNIGYTTDSWLAGQDGPPAMIMPGDPKVGQAFRTENIPGQVFEEVTVKTVEKTVPGPTGPVRGAMVGEELHDDAMTSDKVFAPGYGEFSTRDADGVEAMALAVPTDGINAPTPTDLENLLASADHAQDAVESKDWRAVSSSVRRVTAAWQGYRRAGKLPPRLEPPMRRAIGALSGATQARDPERAGTAAIDVAQAALDLELQYRPPAAIDLARFALWTRQLTVDAGANNLGGVTGDLATMEWTRDRFAQNIDPTDLTRINASILTLRDSVLNKDLRAAGTEAASLDKALGGVKTST